MCLIVLSLGATLADELIVLANRDERHARPTAPLARWADEPRIVAGRDLEAGGTWLGVAPARRRIAMLTNVRDPRDLAPRAQGAPSRGALVTEFLLGAASAVEFAEAAHQRELAGFNLIAIDEHGAFHASNRAAAVTRLTPGLHGLSNATLDTPWPKVQRAKTALEAALAARADDETLLAILADPTRAPDAALPDTGVGLELERALSPICIDLPGYGTRCSTLLRLRAGTLRLVERRRAPDAPGETTLDLAWG